MYFRSKIKIASALAQTMAEETGMKLGEPSWTDFELKLESFRKSQCKEQDGPFLKDRFRARMQESSLGDFLFHLNSKQLQEEHVQWDKLDRVRFDISAGLKDPNELERRNDLCEDVLGLIEGLLRGNPSGTITLRSALRNMEVLRLAGSKVQSMDKSLKFSANLHCLILAGCCVQDFPGEFLPRGLMMLEMYCNQLERLDLLTCSCPPNILYLGLGRNYLTQGVLEPLRKLEFLLYLDLSDNDIEDVVCVASVCQPLANLTSIVLQGNPCSVDQTAFSPQPKKECANSIYRKIQKRAVRFKRFSVFVMEHFKMFIIGFSFDAQLLIILPPFALKELVIRLGNFFSKCSFAYYIYIECLGSCIMLADFINTTRFYPLTYEMNYAHIIATLLPKLLFLDGEVLKRSNDNILISNKDCKETASISTLSGTLQISLIRILSFPQPKNEKMNKKKVTHTFRVEVLCPLLLKYMPENKESFIKLKTASITGGKNLTNVKKKDRSSSKSLIGKRTKRKDSKSSGKQKSNGGKSKKKKSTGDDTKNVEEQFDETLCFLSERKKWSKIMEFPEPTIEIPHCDLTLLRNVFKSKIIIYITHLKTLPPVKAKTKTKKKKSMVTEETPDKKDAAKEILVNKTVVAKLKIPLHSIVWSETSLDYSWSQQYPTRVVESTSLKDLKYVVKKKQLKSKKGKEQGDSTEIQIPKELTVHVGIGVKRSCNG